MSTILVADDNEGVRLLLRTALTLAGYEVREASDGEEAWGMLRAGRLAALVTDVHLPLRSGLALLRAIRADPDLATLPVVVLSGDAAWMDRAMACGANAFLSKPFRIAEIEREVGRAIGRRGALWRARWE